VVFGGGGSWGGSWWCMGWWLAGYWWLGVVTALARQKIGGPTMGWRMTKKR